MRQGILAIAAVGLVAAALASHAAGQSVGAPASQIVVAAGQDWATRTFQKPIDMNQWTDVSWWLYANDGPLTNLSGVTHTTCTGGGSTSTCLKATTSGTDSNLWILETGNPPSSRIGKTGDNFPIDASTYKTVAVRMRLDTGGACTLALPTLACTAGYLWHKGTLYDTPTTETRSNSFFTFDGWQIYFIDLPTFGYASGSPLAPWTGTIGDLRLNLTATAGAAIEIDWIRLVPDNLPTQTITWSGFSGNVDVYLDDNQTASDGNLGVLTASNQALPARNVSGGSHTFQPGALAAGDYYVEICPTGADPATSNGCRYSSGFYRVNDTPTFTFTSPSPEGSSDDFATVQLNQAWDMTSTSQVDYAVNVSGLTATTIAAVNEAGSSLGNVNVLQGTSAAAGQVGSGDPYMYFLWFAGDGRGRYKKIDSSRYHILTLEMGVPDKARDINLGSIARVVWLIEGEEAKENVSKDLIFNSRAGSNVMSKIITSMRTCEPSVTEWNHCLRIVTEAGTELSTTGWAGNIENFRLDPHEYPDATTFYVKNFKLAANEKTVSNQYTIRWTYADLLAPGTPTLTLYYDTDIDPSSGLTQIVTGVNPAISSSYTWNTTGVPNGTYYIYASVSDGLNANAAYSRWPIIVDSSTTSALLPRIALNRRRLDFGGNDNGRLVGDPQTVSVAISGTGASSVRWKVTSSNPLVLVSPVSGTGSGTFDVSIASSTIYPDNMWGDYYVTVEESVAGTTSNSAQYIRVVFTMYPKTGTSAPFGAFDTPVNGTAGMQGSFAVTGWALDDVGIDHVEIWRDLTPTENLAHAYTSDPSHPAYGKVFIARPLFVADARPDVESLYAGTPAAYRAGWGYLLLSWGLEGRGNGSYTLYAFAFDKDGHATPLGTKTISVDNVHASKPFGSIDTPGYGETKSGVFVNFGWALTPAGDSSCRIDNGHVFVSIDSLPLALVNYGDARSDIATAFPDFLNGTNASGAYYVDTTALTNGRHQIGWLVYDNCGRGDGIGSRFFNVLNSGARPSLDFAAASGARPPAPALPGVSREPVTVRHVAGDWQVIEPNADGVRVIEVGQSDRIEVRLPLAAGSYTGYLDTQGARRRLPLGSSLDERGGIFYWQPAPGFLGRYDLVFVAPGGMGVRLGVVVGPSMRMAIDTPASGAEVRRPFAVAGWALDLAGEQGSGVDTVHVWAYPAGGAPPIWLGVAEYGDPRPDVGALYGTTFTKAAYTLVVGHLSPGTYDIVVYVHRAKTGSFDAAQIVRFTVR
ncbi:MAG: hypothetical protein NTV05_16675 [Acidobacteria bacterium]|nr:hypothetical protein [Acidobacteriota bacterium]